jgi:glyoxylase-like metal-dependent hydrolase (beta-lactamase superfamily II)
MLEHEQREEHDPMTLANRLELRTRPVGAKQMNTYVLICPQTRESVLFDPGDEPDVLTNLLEGSTPTAIILTHTHSDHIGALDEMRARLQVPLLAHPGPHTEGVTLEADRWLNDGDTVRVGEYTLRAIHTPGHSRDMLSFAVEGDNRIIVGDTLFDGGPGKTWSPDQFRTTLDTLRTIVLSWPDESVCYPGHGPAFRLGDRREAIDAFVHKDHGDFYGDASWDM